MDIFTAERLKKRAESFQNYAEEMRKAKKTDHFAVNLRKNKRNQGFKEKRSAKPKPAENSESFNELTFKNPSNLIIKHFPGLINLKNISEIIQFFIQVLKSDEVNELVLLQILSMFSNYFCEKLEGNRLFFHSDLINVLGFYVSPNFSDEIASKAMLCLCNLAFGPVEYVQEMHQNDIYSKIVYGLQRNHSELIANTLWLIGNLVPDNEKVMRTLLDLNIFAEINKISIHSDNIDKSLVFCLINICANINLIDNFYGRIILDMLKSLVSADFEGVLLALFYFAQGDDLKIDLLLSCNLINLANKTIQEVFMTENSGKGIKSQEAHLIFLKLCGIISAGKNDHTDFVLNLDIFPLLHKNLSSPDPEIVKCTYWVLSNIAAGSYPHRNMLKGHPIFESSIKSFDVTRPVIAKEALIYLRNFSFLATVEQKIAMIESGIFFQVFKCFRCVTLENLKLLIEVVMNLLKISKYIDCKILKNFEETGCLEEVKKLQQHNNPQISTHASEIINEFFP